MNDLDTNDLSPPEKIGKIRKRGKKKKKHGHVGCSCQKAIDFAKAVKAAIAAPKAAAAPKSADLVKHSQTGKLVSKRSKTGRTECSQAMSDWKRGHPTPQTFSTLAKCRSIAAGYKRAQGHREAGREAMAQSLEKRYSGQHVTVKERTARAQELKQQRREKLAATPQPAATAQPAAAAGPESNKVPERVLERVKKSLGEIAARSTNIRSTPTQSVTVEQGGTRGPLPKSSKPMATPGRTDTAPKPYVKPKAAKPKAVGRGTPERIERAERIKQAKKKDVTTTARSDFSRVSVAPT